MIIGVLWALLALLGFGLQPVFVKEAVRKANLKVTSVYIHSIAVVLLTLVLVWHINITAVETHLLAIIIGGMILGGINVFVMYAAFHYAPAGIAQTILNAGVLLVVPLSWWLFAESITVWQIGGIIIVLVGASLLVDEYRKRRTQDPIPYKGVLFALLTSVLFVMYGLTSKVAINAWGAGTATLLLEIGVLITMIGYVGLNKDVWYLPVPRRNLQPILFAGIGLAAGAGGFYLAIEQLGLALTSGILAATPAATTVFARYYLKEQLDLKKYVSIVVVIAGLLLIALS